MHHPLVFGGAFLSSSVVVVIVVATINFLFSPSILSHPPLSTMLFEQVGGTGQGADPHFGGASKNIFVENGGMTEEKNAISDTNLAKSCIQIDAPAPDQK